MLRNRLYYGVKPLLPQRLRLGIRRWMATRKRPYVRDQWPILPGSECEPAGWPGWPEGKKFALVLTHDVESQAGVGKCIPLMELEMKHGFRSCFNFIPEGEYRVSAELRETLIRNGFEVGVHDLHHDGKLYHSRSDFQRSAAEINRYLREWGASGFRSAFMLHNLDWIKDLNVLYDASTFDTDPFEPQPHGKQTIFPFWVSRTPSSNGSVASRCSCPEDQDSSFSPGSGYVELPYTLPQDSTLFLLLWERHPDIWFEKLDWIVKHGGMALLDTHPDYMNFGGSKREWQYSIEMYDRFLEYASQKYTDLFWHALPMAVAKHYRSVCLPSIRKAQRLYVINRANGKKKPKIWIDLDNTPHVPFFEPILEELKERGYPVLVTARDAFQVCDLADRKRLPYIRVGRHYGRSRIRKASGLLYRACQLAPLIIRERPRLAVSHGARSQLILGNLLGLPSLLLEDYEFARFPYVMRPTWVMAPSVIPEHALCASKGNVRKYTGIKEDVYAWKLVPDPGILSELGASDREVLVTVRPPATEAHYHNPESETLFSAFMNRAARLPGVKVVLLPRNKKQGDAIMARFPIWFQNGNTVIPQWPLDGMNLIWHSDLVVSGGGTMNREAAALGVPVYSIFRGAIGAVDRHLQSTNRLVLVESLRDVEKVIRIEKRPRSSVAEVTSRRTLHEIVEAIEEIASFDAQ